MKKSIGHALGIILLAASALASATSIQLLRAQSVVQYAEGLRMQFPTVDALVTSTSNTKQVYLQLQTTSGSSVVPMTFNRNAGTGEQIWTATYPAINLGYTISPLTFSLKLVVNGTSYFDTNNGKNYTMAADSGNFLPTLNVYNSGYNPAATVSCTNPSAQDIYGDITVRNIAYAKLINIVYTTDNWKTTHTAAASYSPIFWVSEMSDAANPNQYGFEEWTFAANVGKASKVLYAVQYIVNGQTYWDNNFGQNYSVTVACY